MKNLITKKNVIIAGGIALALIVAHSLLIKGSQSDTPTARAVASLLARSSVSDNDLSTAMNISGVRDAFVVREDGFIGLPATRRGYAAYPDGKASASVSLSGNERVVVEAYKQSQAPQLPLFLIIPMGVVLAVIHFRRRRSVHGNGCEEGSADDSLPLESIDIDLASRAAGAALVSVDSGCRVIAASEMARENYGVSQSSGHIVDILQPEEVQSVLQLVRRCEREGFVEKSVSWRGISSHLGVLKNASGFLIKISKELCDESEA